MGKRGRRSRNRDKVGDSGSGKRDQGKRDAKQGGERKQENALVEWTKSIVIAVILFLIIKTFLLHTFVIISGSMEETLLVGDMLVVNRAALGSRIPGTQIRVPGYTQPKRGDVVVFDPPHEEDLKLVKRLIGRWLCRTCQTPYHATSSPPETPGRCNKCGGELYQRSDDRQETVRERLSVFFAQTVPILDHYKKQSKLIRVNGNLGIQGVAGAIISALKASLPS